MSYRAILVIQASPDNRSLSNLFYLASLHLGINIELVKVVYLLSDPRTKEPFYIGAGNERRVRMRVRDKCEWNSAVLQQRINSYKSLGLSTKVTLLAFFNNVVSGNAGVAQYVERFFKQYHVEELGATLCNRNDMYPATENINFEYLEGYECRDHPLSSYKSVKE